MVFSSRRETEGKMNWEICQMDATGGDVIILTHTPDIDEWYPRVSPDGLRLCFVAVERADEKNRIRNVYVMNIDGTGRKKIAENAYQPCWSPDGRSIAYLPGEYPRYNPRTMANKGLEIYDLDTGEVNRHPNEDLLHLSFLSWSPDGEWFVATPQVMFKVEDETFIRLSMGGCTPDLGPLGKRIVWNGTDWNLNIGELDINSTQNNVTDHKMVVACNRGYWVYRADWSPDGKYLAFTYGLDDEVTPADVEEPWSHICVCDLETGKWTQITTGSSLNDSADWIPVQANRE
jgi:Tol biopolymer transport system component